MSGGEYTSHKNQMYESELRNIVVNVTIKAGRDLAAKDLNGKSDPYCIIGLCQSNHRFVGPRKRTPIVNKTLQPVWKSDNSFVFKFNFSKVNFGINC